MTDYRSLVSGLRENGRFEHENASLWHYYAADAADAIEALQAENARLVARLEKAREVITPFATLQDRALAVDLAKVALWNGDITFSGEAFRAARAFMEEGE